MPDEDSHIADYCGAIVVVGNHVHVNISGHGSAVPLRHMETRAV